MRNRLGEIVLFAASVLELGAAPALAQYSNPLLDDSDIVYVGARRSKKKMRQRQIIYAAVGGVAVILLGSFFLLNTLDKKAAREKLRRKLLERQQPDWQ